MLSLTKFLLLTLMILPVANCASQEKQSFAEALGLGYRAFDQEPGSGWRKVADAGYVLQAAELIDRYRQRHRVLPEWQRANLAFHAGQLYAAAGDTVQALGRLNEALF